MGNKYIKIYPSWLPYDCAEDKRGFISKRFGNGHTGVDSVNDKMNPKVCAVMDGVVCKVDFSKKYGNIIIYKRGNVQIAHYHLKEVLSEVGDMVQGGVSVIGVEGNTGELSKGKHLHTSMWIDGELVDPEPYLSGQKEIHCENGAEIMPARKVIRGDLNLREKPGVANGSYGFIPVGTIINPTETVKVGSATWGKHTCIMADGKEHTGWSNIHDWWSEPYSGALMAYKDESEEISALKNQLHEANQKIEAAKSALE
jgi:hypothetical protein